MGQRIEGFNSSYATHIYVFVENHARIFKVYEIIKFI